MPLSCVNPYTDFGFKKLFGEEACKDLLIDFLNEVLPPEHKIAQLSFKPTIQTGLLPNNRGAVYDIYCESPTGQKFIVEMQKAGLAWFKDRMLFYSTFPIQEQAQQGLWDFKLAPVYCVAIMGFQFSDSPQDRDVLSRIQLKNQYCEVFTDKLTYIFVEMPRFHKEAHELTTHFEKWLYFLKHLEDLSEIPAILNEPIFEKGFQRARLANLNHDELWLYQQSLKAFRDNYAALETAKDKGLQEGREEGLAEGFEKGLEKGIATGEVRGETRGELKGKRETARAMKAEGLSNELIARTTGLTLTEIEQLT